MITEQMKMKLEYYEQFYFSLDEPIPFKKGLKIYPVMVKDYYKFYSLIPCFTFDKNQTMEGISMSNLSYAFKLMEDKETGRSFISRFIALLELIFHIQDGLYCDNENCEDYNKKKIYYYDENYYNKIQAILDSEEKTDEERADALFKMRVCPKCGKPMRGVFSIKEQDNKKSLSVYDIEIMPKEFDEIKEIVCYQNMPDYNDDYIDPKLKAELEAKAKLENPNAVSPTLEKQLICISISSPYTIDMLKEITIRKMVLMLRTIDAKAHYFCYKQGEMSGKHAMPLYIVKCIAKLIKLPGVPKIILAKIERLKRKYECHESRKNRMNGIWLNPKYC